MIWRTIGKPAPPADMSKDFAVAVFLGVRPTGGFTVSWKARHSSQAHQVQYTVNKPEGIALQALTQPFSIRLFPKLSGKIEVVGVDD